MSYHYLPEVRLESVDAQRTELVVAIPLEQTAIVREALATLTNNAIAGVSAQDVVVNALRAVTEQTYFWTPEWQAKENAADLAIAEGRVQTFDQIEDMITFLDEQ